jgi:transposase
MEFRNIYEMSVREDAKQKILDWISKTKLLQLTVFNTVANSLNYHLETILNFFINRNTNANAEYVYP